MFCDGEDCNAEIDHVQIIVSPGVPLNFFFGEQEYARNWYRRALVVKSDKSSTINVKIIITFFLIYITLRY